MARRGGRRTGSRSGKTVKASKRPSKKSSRKFRLIRTRPKKRVKSHPRAHRAKTAVKRRLKAVIKRPVKVMAEEQRVLEKLPPAKPLRLDRQVVRVFGHKVEPNKIKNAAMEAYSKRCYTIDDIPVEHFIRDAEWDNLMTKIGILDRIEEQLNLMYPHVDVLRKNKICIELYLRR